MEKNWGDTPSATLRADFNINSTLNDTEWIVIAIFKVFSFKCIISYAY